MSSTIVSAGPISISATLLGSVAALGGTAIAATCVASGAAIGATIGLPLYAAYKSGDFAFQLSKEIISSRHLQQENEAQAIKKELSARFTLQQKVEDMKQLSCDDDIVQLLSSLTVFLEDTSSPSRVLHSINQNCATLLDNISQEIEKRKKHAEKEHMRAERLQTLKNYFYQNVKMEAVQLSYTTTAQAPARSGILENALEKYFKNERKNQLHYFYALYTELQKYVYEDEEIKPISAFSSLSTLQDEINTLSVLADVKITNVKTYASLIEQAKKRTRDLTEAEQLAQQAYVQTALQSELKHLNIISDGAYTSLNTTQRYYKSGCQTLKETVLPGGYSTLELLTPSHLIQQSKPVMVAQQKVKCQEMEKLSLLLKSKWGVNFNPLVVNDKDTILSEEADLLKTNHSQIKNARKLSGRKLTHQNSASTYENFTEEH